MKARAARRGIVLVLALSLCAVRFFLVWLLARLRGRKVTSLQRAQWMHFCGLIMLKAIGIEYRVEGKVPSGGVLIAANHLSYLDIVIFSAALPSLFVAKDEIERWPGFGPLSRMGGAIYVDRSSRLSAWDAAETMSLRLADHVPVTFFPESTSTDGSEVLRFHSTLFDSAVSSGLPVVPAAVFYEPTGVGIVERDMCWYGDEPFLPHLRRVLEVTDFMAVVQFGEPEVFPDRRTAAWRSHDAVSRMRAK